MKNCGWARNYVPMDAPASPEPSRRLQDRIDAWRIVVEDVVETDSSILAFGRRDSQPVVLKVIRQQGEEWRSGEVLSAFEGHGVVRVVDRTDGAVLLERLRPGGDLAGLSVNGEDDRATAILADVMGSMSPRRSVTGVPTVEDWGRGLARHADGGHRQIPTALLERAHHVYARLYASQSAPRLLHGDLHHYNVLLDHDRGWLAIDAKGVVGEAEYEIGAALRNPYERPDLFADPTTIARRVDTFARELHLDAGRILGWAFAQAVLAAAWAVEDGAAIEPDNGWIALANCLRPMLGDALGT